MLTINNTQYRNLEEQVRYNTDLLNLLPDGIMGSNFQGFVDSASDIEVGKIALVGIRAPYTLYYRVDEGVARSLGEFPKEGTQGERGLQGPQGTKGESGSTWTVGNDIPSGVGRNGDMYLKIDTADVYSVINGQWTLVGNIRGRQGTRGERGLTGATGQTGAQGPVGPQGMPGASYNIQGQVATVDELPSASSNKAYLVGQHLYISIGGQWVDTGAIFTGNVSVVNTFGDSQANAGSQALITKVQENLTTATRPLEEEIIPTLIQDQYFNVDSTFQPTTSAATTGYVPTASTDSIYVKCGGMSSGVAYLVAFLDENKNVLPDISIIGSSSVSSVETTFDMSIPAYENVKYIVCSGYGSHRPVVRITNTQSLRAGIESNTTEISSIKTAIQPTLRLPYSVAIPTTTGRYLDTDGEFVANAAGHTTDFVDIRGYNQLYVRTRISSGGYAVAFFDTNKQLIPNISVAGTNQQQTLIYDLFEPAYANAAYMVISSYNFTITATLFNKPLLQPFSNTFASFAKFGVIGDSLSVGHTYNPITGEQTARNIYYSWPQYIARRVGNVALNFGHSGITAKSWFNNSNCYAKFNMSENLCQTYIIALGANDAERLDDYSSGLGTVADIEANTDTFYGWYSNIITLIRNKSPHAPIFLLTLPYPRSDSTNGQLINEAIRNIASLIEQENVFLIDLATDYRSYSQDFHLNDTLNSGHFSAPGYEIVSHIIEYAISQVITNNPNKFRTIPFLPYGTNNVIN